MFYALMGPLVVGMVSIAVHGEKSSAVLVSMMSVFALVATFVGGMNVAMDAIAGERERRSLLPLLMNPLLRRDVIIGKWLAISLFAVAGVIINLSGFAVVVAFPFDRRNPRPHSSGPVRRSRRAADFHLVTQYKGSAYLPLASHLPPHGHRHVSGILSAHGFDVALVASGRSAIADRSPHQGRASFASFIAGAKPCHRSLRGAHLTGRRETLASR